jgi:hypothetical protein
MSSHARDGGIINAVIEDRTFSSCPDRFRVQITTEQSMLFLKMTGIQTRVLRAEQGASQPGGLCTEAAPNPDRSGFLRHYPEILLSANV